MKTKDELRQAHGTPEQFKAAIRRAVASGMITQAEGQAAIKKYEREYADAPGK